MASGVMGDKIFDTCITYSSTVQAAGAALLDLIGTPAILLSIYSTLRSMTFRSLICAFLAARSVPIRRPVRSWIQSGYWVVGSY